MSKCLSGKKEKRREGEEEDGGDGGREGGREDRSTLEWGLIF